MTTPQQQARMAREAINLDDIARAEAIARAGSTAKPTAFASFEDSAKGALWSTLEQR